MKNSVTFLLLVLAMAIMAISDAAAFSGGGSGTAGDPYQITNVDQLQEMNDDKNAYYKLMNDIDASATSGWNSGAGFVPIGDNSNRFYGSLDGQGYEISGLYINRPSTDYVGLFGYLGSGGEVKNVGLIDVNITGVDRVGGLIGRSDGAVNNSYTTGSVNGNNSFGDYAGGFCGINCDGTINNCYSTASVSGRNGIGGFCGRNDETVNKCFSTGNVTGSGTHVGGFCGENWDEISKCYSAGNVNGGWYCAGGFCAMNIYGDIDNCYSTGDVDADDRVGGFCGRNWSYSNVSKCYSTGSVTGSSNVGGFCGQNESTISDCFWDTQTSGKATSSGGTGRTTAQMQTQSTFDPPWDFTNLWYMCNNTYPKLKEVQVLQDDVWVSGSYSSSGSNDDHLWSINAFNNLSDAICQSDAGGDIHITGDITHTGDLTLGSSKMIILGDGDLTVTGQIFGADENSYIVTNGTGRLILQTTSAITFHVGTSNFYAPCTITAPVGNSFGVSVQSWGAFPSRCFWDIEHTAGSDLADVEFIYTKSGVPTHAGDMAAESYVYHFTGTEWENLTPGGASTGDWSGNTSYYSTTATCVTEFSPFAPVGASGLIPTLTEWAAIIMGGLLLIFGGWFVWRRIT